MKYKVMQRRVFFLLPLLILGCSLGPDYERPAVVLPEGYRADSSEDTSGDVSEDGSEDRSEDSTRRSKDPKPESEGETERKQETSDQERQDANAVPPRELSLYWQNFQDESLDALIEASDAGDLSLEEALLRVEEASALLGFSQANFFPNLDMSAALQRRRRSEAVASAIASPRNDYLGIGGFMGWELDVLGRLRRLNESASADYESALEDYRDARVLLRAQVVSTYIDLRTLEAQIAFTEENIRSQGKTLALARQLHRAGIVPELDVYQAESNLGETEAALPALKIQLARAKHRLAVFLGGFSDDVENLLLLPSSSIPKIENLTIETLPRDILRQRPDLRSLERRLAAEHALIGVAEAEYYPIVSLPGEFRFEALNTLEDAFRSGSLAYSIGPSIRWNVFSAGRVSHAVTAQEKRMAQAAVRYRRQVLVAVEEVENAMFAIVEERKRRDSLQRSVKASARSVELVMSLYRSGLTDFENVLASERRLFLQQISLANSHGALAQNFVNLFRALGGGWD